MKNQIKYINNSSLYLSREFEINKQIQHKVNCIRSVNLFISVYRRPNYKRCMRELIIVNICENIPVVRFILYKYFQLLKFFTTFVFINGSVKEINGFSIWKKKRFEKNV